MRGRGEQVSLQGPKWEFTPRRLATSNTPSVTQTGRPGGLHGPLHPGRGSHSLIEGMTICGYAVGAAEGYIYCRAEYPLAIKRLRNAIAQAEETVCWAIIFLAPMSAFISISRKEQAPLSVVRKPPSWPRSKAGGRTKAETSLPRWSRVSGESRPT